MAWDLTMQQEGCSHVAGGILSIHGKAFHGLSIHNWQRKSALSGPTGASKLFWRSQVFPLGLLLCRDHPFSSKRECPAPFSTSHLARAVLPMDRGVSVWAADPQVWLVVVQMVSPCWYKWVFLSTKMGISSVWQSTPEYTTHITQAASHLFGALCYIAISASV